VTQVCLRVGYESLGSFSTPFAAGMGQFPLARRRSMRSLVQVPRAWARLTIPCCFQGLWFP
jgi:AraC-like DNA-binding protein